MEEAGDGIEVGIPSTPVSPRSRNLLVAADEAAEVVAWDQPRAQAQVLCQRLQGRAPSSTMRSITRPRRNACSHDAFIE